MARVVRAAPEADRHARARRIDAPRTRHQPDLVRERARLGEDLRERPLVHGPHRRIRDDARVGRRHVLGRSARGLSRVLGGRARERAQHRRQQPRRMPRQPHGRAQLTAELADAGRLVERRHGPERREGDRALRQRRGDRDRIRRPARLREDPGALRPERVQQRGVVGGPAGDAALRRRRAAPAPGPVGRHEANALGGSDRIGCSGEPARAGPVEDDDEGTRIRAIGRVAEAAAVGQIDRGFAGEGAFGHEGARWHGSSARRGRWL